MAREVNVSFSQPTTTGINVSVPQYTMDVTFQWIDNAGVSHTQTQTVLFPNVLQQIPASDLLDLMKQVIIVRARTVLGVDS
jgi:hypothetical protein